MKDLDDLKNYLFDALDRLNDAKGEDLEREIDRAHAVGSVATQIINSTALQVKVKEMTKNTPRAIPNYKKSEITCEA